jgi:hypothetical protein
VSAALTKNAFVASSKTTIVAAMATPGTKTAAAVMAKASGIPK